MKNEKENTEFDHFSALANDWWSQNGKFKILHDIQPIRIKYILEALNKKSLNNWKKRDPINRLYLSMLNKKLISKNQFNLLEKKIKDKIKKISKSSLKMKFYGTPYHEKFVY